MKLLIFLCGLSACLVQAYNYKTFWFETKIDQFSFVNNDTFRIRVLYNDDHFDAQSPGPVFFYTGNEGDIEMFANNAGLMWDWAANFGALLIFAEHRFYGKTLPFGDKSYSSVRQFGYLTVEQALADFAALIEHVKQVWPVKKVVAFGGSYGGMLSAWLRIKYPWLVDAALASSAPILQFQDVTPCETYNIIVTKAFKRESQKCVDNIRKSWIALETLAKSQSNGASEIRKIFRLCQNVVPSNYTVVRDWLYDTFGNLAMVNYPYVTDFLKKVPGHPVNVSCSFLNRDFNTNKDLLLGVYQAVNVFHNFTGTAKCNDVTGGGGDNLGADGWDIQTCNEMVMPFCADGKEDMFYKYSWNFTEFRQSCEKRFSMTPSLNIATRMFGGKDIKSASNIIFSNGEIDPWSGGGVLTQLSPLLPVVIIKGGAHHYDLRAAHPQDTPEVITARVVEKEYIKLWISSQR